jgi:hypothetical protein
MDRDEAIARLTKADLRQLRRIRKASYALVAAIQEAIVAGCFDDAAVLGQAHKVVSGATKIIASAECVLERRKNR